MRILIILLLAFFFQNGKAQSIGFGVGYQYQYSPEYVKAIQAFNLSRPWVEEKQPLLEDGMVINFEFLFPGEKLVKHGIYSNYLFYRSYSINSDYENAINQHGLNIGYLLRLDGSKMKRFFVDFGAALAMNFLERKLNNEWVTQDESKKNGFGIGWNFDFRFGYQIAFVGHKRQFFSPFIGFGAGRVFNPNAESVINQTTGVATEDCSWLIVGRAGILIELGLKKEEVITAE